MLLSELLNMSAKILEEKGDIRVFIGDMKEPQLAVEESCFPEEYGKEHLVISE